MKMLELRCYAKKDGDAYVAVCIDLCLAAQGDSMHDAIEKLDSMIKFYIADVIENEHDYVHKLLPRKAPLSQRFTYYLISLLSRWELSKRWCKGYMEKFLDHMPPSSGNGISHHHV